VHQAAIRKRLEEMPMVWTFDVFGEHHDIRRVRDVRGPDPVSHAAAYCMMVHIPGEELHVRGVGYMH
jgi:hypothetical protein